MTIVDYAQVCRLYLKFFNIIINSYKYKVDYVGFKMPKNHKLRTGNLFKEKLVQKHYKKHLIPKYRSRLLI